MSGVISRVPIGRMERLEELCWRCIKEELVGKKKKVSFKKLSKEEEVKRKEEQEELRRKQKEMLHVEGVLGWRYTERVKMLIKEDQWRDVHRDILSTHICNSLEHMYQR